MKPENSTPKGKLHPIFEDIFQDMLKPLPPKEILLSDFLHRCSGCPEGTTVHFYMYGEPYEVDEQWLANGRYTIVLKPKGVSR